MINQCRGWPTFLALVNQVLEDRQSGQHPHGGMLPGLVRQLVQVSLDSHGWDFGDGGFRGSSFHYDVGLQKTP